jgi:arylsulfatase A-like enzyme
VGFYGLAALFVGIAEATVAAGLFATVTPDLRGWLYRVRADRERDRAQAAALVALALALTLEVVLVFAYSYLVAYEMAARRNGALSTAIVAAALVPLLALGWFPLYQIARQLVLVLPRPRVLVLLAGLVSVVALALVATLGTVEWRVIDFGPYIAFGLFVGLEAGWAALLYAGPLARARSSVAPRIRRLLGGGLAAVVLLSAAVSWLRFGDEPRSLALVLEESWGAKIVLKAARKLADHDGDGYAGRLGGGDCDDHNARIHPGADEIRGNGIDEDCDGVDPPAVAARAHLEAESAEVSKYAWKGNLLVITIDTLRADRLNPTIMPRASAFAKQAVVFSRAYSQAPNTPRSFPSFLTSRFPSEVKWVRMAANFSPIQDAPQNTTVFQALHGGGFFTSGVFSHFYLTSRNGIDKGFDEWDNEGALSLHDSNTDIAAPRIAAHVIAKLKELKGTKQRFALWTHLFDPHSRYMEHEEWPVRSTGLKGLEEKYDGEVFFDDKYLGQILDALAETGLDQNTAVVIFSDHGEAFGEHHFGGERIYFHGQTLYDEILHVPFVIKVPGLKPRVIDTPVMLVDLAPTLLDLVKIKRPDNFHGRSLLPGLLGEKLAAEPTYAELLPTPSWNHRGRAIMDGDLKLIQKLSENTIELYDLKQDPGEQRNLAVSDGERAAEMQRKLTAFVVEEDNG